MVLPTEKKVTYGISGTRGVWTFLKKVYTLRRGGGRKEGGKGRRILSSVLGRGPATNKVPQTAKGENRRASPK